MEALATGRAALSQDSRRQLLEGGLPSLQFPNTEPSPWAVGDRVSLARNVDLVVQSVSRRPRTWAIGYTVEDRRPRLLRQGAPGHTGDEDGRHWSPDEEHGYTSSPASALVDAGEAPPPEFQERLSAEGHERWEEGHAQEMVRRNNKQLGRKVRRLLAEAAEHDIDLSGHLSPMVKAAQRTIAQVKTSQLPSTAS